MISFVRVKETLVASMVILTASANLSPMHFW